MHKLSTVAFQEQNYLLHTAPWNCLSRGESYKSDWKSLHLKYPLGLLYVKEKKNKKKDENTDRR